MICLIESTALLHADVLDVLHVNLEQTPKTLVICHSPLDSDETVKKLTTGVLYCLSCTRCERLYIG